MPEHTLPAGVTLELPDITVDRSSPIPAYFQLAELFEHEITSGRWQPGTRLPSEPELCERFTLSRTTIRQALGRLEHRGLVDRLKGQGTFVQKAQPGLWVLQSSAGFFQEEVDRLGRTVTSRILGAERGTLPEWACQALELPNRSEGATLNRLRMLDGQVALYVVNHLAPHAADPALNVSNPNESLYRRLKEHGITAHGGRRTLEAVPAEPRIAGLLELNAGDPVALIQSVAWDAELRPFDCYRAWLRTDRTQIVVHAVGPEAASTHPLSTE
jgi:GntR family transcriptional regulator